MFKSRKVRVSSLDNEKLGKKSPFVKNQNLADYMKASLVNNAIFHTDFDATLVDKENLEMAKSLLGCQDKATKLGMPQDNFDKRYF